jgi:hypothetical protein
VFVAASIERERVKSAPVLLFAAICLNGVGTLPLALYNCSCRDSGLETRK